jgi:hypothetical protein
LPPGAAHSIGEQIVHILHAEDYIVAGMLQGKQPIWERDGWAARTGLPNLMRLTDDAAGSFKGDIARLEPYKSDVYAQTSAYLAGITDADLDREMELPVLGKMTVAGLLTMLLIGNTFAHTGEISALKGIQEQRGYPF